MKSLLAKTLTSTALVLVTFSAAHAYSDNKGPWPAESMENYSAPLPAQIKYFEERAARTPVNSAGSGSSFPAPIESDGSLRWFSPDQIRYFEQREAAIAKEPKNRPSRMLDYIPRGVNSGLRPQQGWE